MHRSSIRRAVGVALLVLLTVTAGTSIAYDPVAGGSLGPGTIEQEPRNATVVSTQGVHFAGRYDRSRPPRLLSIEPDGPLRWQYEGDHGDGVGGWFYDVDPLPNGNLLVVSPREGETLVYELDRETRERVWTERLPFTDTHDIDRLDDGRLVVAHMRADATGGVSGDRVVVWNRTRSEVSWEWRFADHFSNDTAAGADSRDWTHVNDVDPVGEDRLLLSPRNFDQAIVVDMESKEIVERLGSDDDYSVMREQHNPDWLLSEDGNPTILVADSENNRVVEYAKEDGEWVRTWEVGSNTLTWPRDADRLPNGNTLVTDTLNHRVMEITPTGEVVWEYYATWGPYDAERMGTGPESSGPTIRDMNASGTYPITGSANLTAGGNDSVGFDGRIRATFAGTPIEGPMNEFATRWAHVTPWLRPVWMSGWDFVWTITAALVGAVWVSGELIAGRRKIVAGARRLAAAVRRLVDR